MDNATHTLAGLALARCGIDKLGPAATVAVVVGANLPDADVAVQPWGQAAFLIHHRGITHAVLGLVLQAPLLALAVFAVARLAGSKARFAPLLLAASVGLASHPLLDLLNTYGVRPWLPFSEERYHGDIAFILDPWLWLIFGTAAWIGTERTPRATGPWLSFAGIVLLFVATEPRGGPGFAAVILAGIVAAVTLGRHRLVRADRARAARAVVAVALVYLAALFLLGRAARSRGLETIEASLGPRERVLAASIHPQPGRPWTFEIMAASETQLRAVSVDLARGTRGEVELFPRRLDDPELEKVRDTDEHAAWVSFARHPFVARHEGGLVLGDGRYGFNPRPSWCNLRVKLPE